MKNFQDLLERYDQILSGGISDLPSLGDKGYKSYAVTNFRGGIGKTTLSFNLAYSLCKKYMTLFMDMCPQKNFSSLFLSNNNNFEEKGTIYDGMMKAMMGEAWTDTEQALRVQDTNENFRDGKTCYFIPGSSRLFLFPSQFYSRLNEYLGMVSSQDTSKPVETLILMLKNIIEKQIEENKIEKVLIDTSPFFAGGTHLAWSAVDALIIPVRVDEQSLYSLELTLDMLDNDRSDFNTWRTRAGISHKPVVQAILMTHCGWNRQADHKIDSASKSYIERAINICNKYTEVFSTGNPIDHFALLSDFHSSGRISGSKAIPIDKLVAGRQHRVEGKTLEVNKSVNRYKNELAYAFSLLNC